MKTIKYLGCLLALVFAGASAFAGAWFSNSVQETLGTGWSNTEAWVWNSTDGFYNSWDKALTYTDVTPQLLAETDSTITTSVKFTAMDIEDLKEQTIGVDVKGGLTVVEDASTTPATLSYYGIVNDAGTKKWMLLTGAAPTLDAFVTVTVELKNNLDNTYTITYKIGETALTVSDASFTMATATGATISTVEYLGQFSLASLAGGTWFNPCTVASPSITGIASVSAYDASSLSPYALNAIPRGATVKFAFEAATGYSASVKAASYTTTGEEATESVTWTNYVVAAAIPAGDDKPSKITVDETAVQARVAGGAAGGTEGYLYTEQANGQLGWVNVTLGIADNASGTIAPTNGVPVENEIAIDFGVVVPSGVTVTYNVGGDKGQTSPNIGLTGSKAANTGIVDVEMVLKDEGGKDHVISTATVGVMETGKDVNPETPGTTYDIVAVPWTAFDGDDITVANLLNTAMLTEGDVLYIQKVANGDNVAYDQYTLTEGVWVAAVGSPSAAGYKLVKGTAIWIERSNQSRIVFMGAPKAEDAPAPQTAVAGKWTLIANPSINPLDLTTIKPNANDIIVIEDLADPRQYTYDSENGWGYTKMVTENKLIGGKTYPITKPVWVENSQIEPGIGFWYVNNGEKDVTISFPNNNSAN